MTVKKVTFSSSVHEPEKMLRPFFRTCEGPRKKNRKKKGGGKDFRIWKNEGGGPKYEGFFFSPITDVPAWMIQQRNLEKRLALCSIPQEKENVFGRCNRKRQKKSCSFVPFGEGIKPGRKGQIKPFMTLFPSLQGHPHNVHSPLMTIERKMEREIATIRYDA